MDNPYTPIGSGPYTYDISAQRIDSDGTIFWSKSGKTICNTPSDQHSVYMCDNGIGKAIISWEDWYPGYYPIEDINIYFTILEIKKGEKAIPFGYMYLSITLSVIIGLVIITKRNQYQNP